RRREIVRGRLPPKRFRQRGRAAPRLRRSREQTRDERLVVANKDGPVLQQGPAMPPLRAAHQLAAVQRDFAVGGEIEAGTQPGRNGGGSRGTRRRHSQSGESVQQYL